MSQPAPRLSFLLDAPAGVAPAKLQIAKIGADFKDPRYGTFAITADEVAQWGHNLAKLPGQRALIDLDHSADKPGADRNTEAAGWITAITLEDGVPTATVEWTPLGETAIREKRYLFFSPTYGPWENEQGVCTEDTCIGGALTNRPFLNMPVISLAKAPASVDGPWHPGLVAAASDSRRQMSTPADLKKLAVALGLAEDADETKILEAITALKTPPVETPATKELANALGLADDADAPKILEAVTALQAAAKDPEPTVETKTLEQLATDAGKMLLDKTQVAMLNAAASKVPTLEASLKELTDERVENRFKLAWDAAVERLVVAPAEETSIRELYAAAPDATIKMLEARTTPVVNAARRGSGAGDDGVAPAGVDAASFALDKRVRAHMLESKEPDYLKALEQVQAADAQGASA
jgi:hypothetical protein